MSFDIYNKKPKLIEPKIYKYYNEKLRTKELKEKIKQDEIIKQQELANIPVILPDPWYKKIFVNIWEFIKENYGFFLIISLIIILLYVRYIEVNSRKKKMKDAIDKINKEKEIQQFIELQEINQQLSQYN
jgi:hypothetical protein